MLTLLDVSNKHISYSRFDLRVIVCWPTLRQTQYARILLRRVFSKQQSLAKLRQRFELDELMNDILMLRCKRCFINIINIPVVWKMCL